MFPAKRKADEEGDEPASKEHRTEEADDGGAERAEPPEATVVNSKESEVDDQDDSRPAIKEKVRFHSTETTLNVVATTGGRILMSLSDGGMQFLIAGARASVGVTSGRYFYEVKVIEALTPLEGRNLARNRVPMPRQLVRIGFSLARSSLILGDGGDSCVCFDSEGFFFADKKRIQASTRFGRDQDVAVLLNLDPKSPSANTVSLFCNGQRISEPMPLPEKMRGQPLFPHVAYRNVTLQVNFGPTPMSPLPFKSRMIQGAAKADVKEVAPERPADGKYQVVFPVGFPDEGTFDWLDDFMEKHPDYMELSDRKILEWAQKSGIWRPSERNNFKHSNDKPEFNFGLQYMDDFSARRCLNAITGVMPRNYVVMEVKQNLTPADRKANLRRFRNPCFKTIAQVVMGEPTKEYKEYIQKKILEEKRAKVDVDFRLRRLERERRRAISQRNKELAERGQLPDPGLEAAEGDFLGEEAEVPEEPLPQVNLTEDERKLWFRQPTASDITPQTLNSVFAQFCTPEEGEGFDEIRYEWQGAEASKAYLRKWVLEKKINTRIEDLQPGEWFRARAAEFQKSCQEWQAKQRAFKDSRLHPKPKPEKAEEEEEDIKKMDIDMDSLENISDMGNGVPLFSEFEFEDWALLTLRFELHTLQAAFMRDVNDPERLGVQENHLLFYYSKYFRKQLNPRCYGKDTPQELVDLVKDAVKIDPVKNVLASALPEEPKSIDAFVKMQEENRRKRQQRIEAGDETARLNFSLLQQLQEQPLSRLEATPKHPPAAYGKGSGKDAGAWPPVPAPAPAFQFSKGGGKGEDLGLWPPVPSPAPGFAKGGGGKGEVEDSGTWLPAPGPAQPPAKGSGKGEDAGWWPPAPAPALDFSKGGGKGEDVGCWPPAPLAPVPQFKGGGKGEDPGCWPPAPAPAPQFSKGCGKVEDVGCWPPASAPAPFPKGGGKGEDAGSWPPVPALAPQFGKGSGKGEDFASWPPPAPAPPFSIGGGKGEDLASWPPPAPALPFSMGGGKGEDAGCWPSATAPAPQFPKGGGKGEARPPERPCPAGLQDVGCWPPVPAPAPQFKGDGKGEVQDAGCWPPVPAPAPEFMGGGKGEDAGGWPPAPLPPQQFSKGGGKVEEEFVSGATPKATEMPAWPPTSRFPKGGAKGDVPQAPVGGPPSDVPGAGPRLVPPPRLQGFQGPPKGGWKEGGGKAGGKWQQNYAPRKGGKKS